MVEKYSKPHTLSLMTQGTPSLVSALANRLPPKLLQNLESFTSQLRYFDDDMMCLEIYNSLYQLR